MNDDTGIRRGRKETSLEGDCNRPRRWHKGAGRAEPGQGMGTEGRAQLSTGLRGESESLVMMRCRE